MTNLIAALVISVVTNVVMVDNEVREPVGFSWNYGSPQPGSIIQPATEKTKTTEVVEIKRLTFTWDGREYTTERKRVLSSAVERWVKREEWVAE